MVPGGPWLWVWSQLPASKAPGWGRRSRSPSVFFTQLNLDRSSEGSEVTLGPLEVVQEGGGVVELQQPACTEQHEEEEAWLDGPFSCSGTVDRDHSPLALQLQISKGSESSTRNRPDVHIKVCADHSRVSVSELHVHTAYRGSPFLRRLGLISRCRTQQSPDICPPAAGRRRRGRTQTEQEVRTDGSRDEDTTGTGSEQNERLCLTKGQKARQEDRRGLKSILTSRSGTL